MITREEYYNLIFIYGEELVDDYISNKENFQINLQIKKIQYQYMKYKTYSNRIDMM